MRQAVLCSCHRVVQLDNEISPGYGLHPASGNQHRSIPKPVSALYIEVTKVPASLIHDKALKDSKFAVRCPHVIAKHMRGAAQMEDLGGLYRLFHPSRHGRHAQLAVDPTCQWAKVIMHGNFLLT